MSLTGYLYTLQVICTVQVTCLVHIYEPNRLFAHFTRYLYSTNNLFCTHLSALIELLAISMYLTGYLQQYSIK